MIMKEYKSTEIYHDLRGVSHNSSKFRFKKPSKRKIYDLRLSPSAAGARETSDSNRFNDDGKRKKRKIKRRSTNNEIPTTESQIPSPNGTCLPGSAIENSLDPEVQFRESLFDAMRDDEGAQFWQDVYGQPIHNYPNIKPGPEGKLERMNDEEYATYVRTKMYEKTHQYLMEEKARRDAAEKVREIRLKEIAEQRRSSEKFRRKVEEAIKRGNHRLMKRTWSDKWNKYLENWKNLEEDGSTYTAIASIPWPVASGKRKDLNLEEIKNFFSFAPTAGQPNELELGKVLKLERVRWHPDKIQQKLGGQDVSESILQAVTSVFQAIDKLWSQIRDKNS